MAAALVAVPVAVVLRYAQNREEAAMLLDVAVLARLLDAAREDAREWHMRATVGPRSRWVVGWRPG